MTSTEDMRTIYSGPAFETSNQPKKGAPKNEVICRVPAEGSLRPSGRILRFRRRKVKTQPKNTP